MPPLAVARTIARQTGLCRNTSGSGTVNLGCALRPLRFGAQWVAFGGDRLPRSSRRILAAQPDVPLPHKVSTEPQTERVSPARRPPRPSAFRPVLAELPKPWSVHLLQDGRLGKATREAIDRNPEGTYLVCLTRGYAPTVAGLIDSVNGGAVLGGITGPRMGPRMYSERIDTEGTRDLEDGFVAGAARYYVVVSAAQAKDYCVVEG